MTWCIKMTNTDIDIDLMFEENLSIGQKMCSILYLVFYLISHFDAFLSRLVH